MKKCDSNISTNMQNGVQIACLCLVKSFFLPELLLVNLTKRTNVSVDRIERKIGKNSGKYLRPMESNGMKKSHRQTTHFEKQLKKYPSKWTNAKWKYTNYSKRTNLNEFCNGFFFALCVFFGFCLIWTKSLHLLQSNHCLNFISAYTFDYRNVPVRCVVQEGRGETMYKARRQWQKKINRKSIFARSMWFACLAVLTLHSGNDMKKTVHMRGCVCVCDTIWLSKSPNWTIKKIPSFHFTMSYWAFRHFLFLFAYSFTKICSLFFISKTTPTTSCGRI